MRSALGWSVGALVAVLIALPAQAAQLALVPTAGHDRLVAIEPIARQLGWTFRRTNDGAILDDGSGPQALRIGSRLVGEDGAQVPLFDAPPAVRNGQLVLAIGDAATLFNLLVVQTGAALTLQNIPQAQADIREIPRPATPKPSPTPSAQPAPLATPRLVQGNAGTLALSMQFDGSNRIYQTSVSGDAGLVRGALSSYGTDTLAAPLGIVTVGPANRNISYGSIANPLAGPILSNGSLSGFDVHATSGPASYDLSSGYGLNGRVVALQRASGGTTDAVAAVSSNGAFQQFLVSRTVAVPQAWGTIDRQTIVGQQGTAFGVEARTRGRTFLDATASVAEGALPLGEGDLPTGMVIGQHLSPVTTISAGYVSSLGAPGSPTFGVSTRLDRVSLAANVSHSFTNLSASYGGTAGYGSLFASTGLSHAFALNAGVAVHRDLAELTVNDSDGAMTAVAQVRTNHPGINLAAGIDLSGGLWRPLAGVVLPVTATLAFEAAYVPAPSGHPGLRLSMIAGFRQPQPHVTTYPVAIVVPDAARYGPLQLYVDGARNAAPYAPGMQVRIPTGWHTVLVQSTDRAYASAPQSFTSSGPTTVDLVVWPQRTIAGDIRFGGPPDAVPPGSSLEGMRVVLEPSGQSATTDAGGHFVFPLGPYDPSSTILLDPDGLPHGFRAPGAVAISDPTAITLEPERATERKSF